MSNPRNGGLLIISRTFPPFTVGSAILMANLFNSYKADMQALACWQYEAKQDPAFKSPCETHYLKFPLPIMQRVYDRLQHRFIGWNKIYIKRKMLRIKPSCVFLVYPSAPFLVAAYQVCKELRIPYVLQMHDLWEENYEQKHPIGILSKKWEAKIFRDAEHRFSMTSIQQVHYQNKYNLEVEILPHTIGPERIKEVQNRLKANASKNQSSKCPTIVYTGNISHKMNLDAMQQFVAMVDSLPTNYRVKMFVSFNVQQCKDLNIYNSRIDYDWLPIEEVQDQMRSADVLFLPLSFKNAAMDEVKTVYATKTLDYLVSGTPILVFSPADSFHTVSAKADGWGLVVDHDSPEAIAAGIHKLVEDKNLAQSIVGAAVKEAERRSASKYADQLLEIVNHI
ncbi:MAG: hypothetical protein NXI09_14155 [Bacteroidetes bacterium]|nr:hypothetical protein [Bacteroidota bacterium]